MFYLFKFFNLYSFLSKNNLTHSFVFGQDILNIKIKAKIICSYLQKENKLSNLLLFSSLNKKLKVKLVKILKNEIILNIISQAPILLFLIYSGRLITVLILIISLLNSIKLTKNNKIAANGIHSANKVK